MSCRLHRSLERAGDHADGIVLFGAGAVEAQAGAPDAVLFQLVIASLVSSGVALGVMGPPAGMIN